MPIPQRVVHYRGPYREANRLFRMVPRRRGPQRLASWRLTPRGGKLALFRCCAGSQRGAGLFPGLAMPMTGRRNPILSPPLPVVEGRGAAFREKDHCEAHLGQ